MRTLLLALIVVVSCVNAFYLPGVSPYGFATNERVDLRAGKLASVKTQIPFDYFSLPLCKPAVMESAAENLGEVLNGDRLDKTNYTIRALEPMKCKELCVQQFKPDEIKTLMARIEEEYRVYWSADNLPAASLVTYEDLDTGDRVVRKESGFPLGFMGVSGKMKQADGVHYIHNHVSMKFLYHEDADSYTGARIVGFEVDAQSIDLSVEGCAIGSTNAYQAVKDDTKEIRFTYDVSWEASPIKWASRWDAYLSMTDDEIHWFSIINSVLIVLFLTGMVAMIMMRTLNRDFTRYSQQLESEEIQEETGWKLVHGDVFRPPARPMLLSVLVGSGVQVFAMTVLTMVFAVLGFLSPAHRGGLLFVMLAAFVMMGYFAGFFASRVFKMFKGLAWKTATIITSLLFPGFVFAIFFILNFMFWIIGSSAAVPFTTLVVILGLWFLISVPLVFLGSYMGFSRPEIEAPVRTNQIPRQIPDQVWYLKNPWVVLIGGILPFGAVFIELFFILTSLWLHRFYYLFGFLFLVLLILGITCAEISVVLCYFQLCSENYHWWWRSFLTPGATALHVFLYSIFYFITRLEITGFISFLLFFGYTLIMCGAVFILTGCIGFWSCLWFVRKIYAAVKPD